jgi:hypothetical protein
LRRRLKASKAFSSKLWRRPEKKSVAERRKAAAERARVLVVMDVFFCTGSRVLRALVFPC